MIRAPQPGPVKMSQFVRDCSHPPFVGTNVLPPPLNSSLPLTELYPALYASPWDGPGCVPSYVNDPDFGAPHD